MNKKRMQFGFALCLFALFLLILPGSILIWALAIPGLVAWWFAFLMLSWWITSELDEWLDSLQYKDLSDD